LNGMIRNMPKSRSGWIARATFTIQWTGQLLIIIPTAAEKISGARQLQQAKVRQTKLVESQRESEKQVASSAAETMCEKSAERPRRLLRSSIGSKLLDKNLCAFCMLPADKKHKKGGRSVIKDPRRCLQQRKTWRMFKKST